MYHQPIKLPFSKLCKSVKSCPRLTFTLLHQFEPFYCLKFYFLSTFNALYRIFSFYLIMSMSETNIFENWKIFSCLFLKANLSNRVHFNETCMNEWVSISLSIQVTSRLLPRMICGQWQEWKKNENEKKNKKKKKIKSSLSWKPERAA